MEEILLSGTKEVFKMQHNLTLETLKEFANADKNIKIMVLNGSRANPNVKKDFMSDFDIRFYVTRLSEALDYKESLDWIQSFGEVVMLQQNNFSDGAFIFLIQYKNGVRLDLSFQDVRMVRAELALDSLSQILIDKESFIYTPPIPNESTYYIYKPTVEKWNNSLNELWWLQGCIGKELWRSELPLAKKLYDFHLMLELRNLLKWHIGVNKNWQVNTGNGDKWFKNYLEPEIYNQFLHFFSSADKSEQWDKLLTVGKFIREIGEPLSKKLGYSYPLDDDIQMTEYVRKIYKLPENATSFEV